MKLLYCALCGDIVAPYRQKGKPRSCECGEYVVWWTDPDAGIIQVHSHTHDRTHGTILGIHNSLLETEGSPSIDRILGLVKGIIFEPSSNFAKAESLIIRFSPGDTSDSSWANNVPPPQSGE